jgi:hypothetical protein
VIFQEQLLVSGSTRIVKRQTRRGIVWIDRIQFSDGSLLLVPLVPSWGEQLMRRVEEQMRRNPTS